jgi:hypothetical protein
MASKKKLLQAAAGSAGGAGAPGPDVDELFSTYLYTGGVSAPLTINNGIDLSGEGGLVWIKNRTSGVWHQLADTERGANKMLSSNSSNAEVSRTEHLKSFTSTGFTIGNDNDVNYDVIGGSQDDEHVSWTWRKAPKLFDVVTYSGNGATRTISHNLGSDVGMLIVKRTDASAPWAVWHRQLNGGTNSGQYYMQLNSTNAEAASSPYWNNTAPTSTEFTVSSDGHVNNASGTYVAYLFAHNNGDGNFGPDGDQDVIKCGSYTGNGSSTGPSVNLGFEPQWIMIKKTNSTQNAHWYVFDAMRGIVTGGDDPYLYANNTNAEVAGNVLEVTPTGFQLNTSANGFNGSSDSYIYMAIRRGPLAEPESATDVFAIDTGAGTSTPMFTSNFPVDMAINRIVDSSADTNIVSRLTGKQRLKTNSTEAESLSNPSEFDFQDGWYDGTLNLPTFYSWMWKRAPSYFDVVAFTKTTSGAQNVSHNLGAVPEMMWIKVRNDTDNWTVYHKDLGNDKRLLLNGTDAATSSNSIFFNNTTPTASQFTIGSIAANSYNFIAYLFATVAGVSKVGSYTGNGSSQNIDCGFSSGARFVLIKRTDVSEGWKVHDSVRGIVAGNDPFVELDKTNATNSGFDVVDPYSGGFAVNNFYGWNGSGGSYIFYAIA